MTACLTSVVALHLLSTADAVAGELSATRFGFTLPRVALPADDEAVVGSSRCLFHSASLWATD